VEKCRHVAVLGGVAAATVGAVTLLGWALGSPFLASGDPRWAEAPGWIPMSPRAALGFIVLGCALVLQYHVPARKAFRVSAAVLAVLMTLWGLVEAWHHTFGVSPVTDFDIYRDLRLGDALREGLMSPVTAVSFLLSGLALALVCWRLNPLTKNIAAFLACLVGFVNLVAALGYLLEAPLLFGGAVATVALPTAIGWLALCVGNIAGAGPDHFALRPLVGCSSRAMLLRAFLPVTLALVLLLGILRNIVSQNLYPGLRELRQRPDVQQARAANTLLSTVIAPLVTVATVFFVARRIGATLEKARTDLNKTLDELRLSEEKAQRATVERDFFLAQVSHELRTPLNHVLGFCQLLELTSLDDSQHHDLDKIHRAGNHLQSLIDDILDYQKIIMGQIPMEWEDFEPASWVAEVAEAMEPKVREKGNRLEVHCDPDLGFVHSDRKRFRQVVTNLLSNAAKFTSQGLVSVTARRELVDGKDWIAVSVADTGKGIAPENLVKLFKPFGQLSDRRENPEGTGLGLAICKLLCEKMGGDIGISSAVGKGSTFTFRLPATAMPASTGTPAPTPPAPPGPAPTRPVVSETRPCRVLVIDDDPQVGELMRRFLENKGFAITVAVTGVQALEMVKNLRPDVITLDMLMPGIDGWGVLAALKNDADIQDIPVIILSIVDDRSRAIRLGANEYVSKPVDWERLATLLNKYRNAPGSGGILVVDEFVRPSARTDGKELYHAQDSGGRR
jgi:signal transduction histidine kinase